MDDGGHRENGRHKADQYKSTQTQWMMQHQPSMKQVMAIMQERDMAIQERNLAISEKKAAIAERDMAFLQRDTALAERNNAIMERDNAVAALHYRQNSVANSNVSSCPPGCQISRGVKHIHHPQKLQQMCEMNDGGCGTKELQSGESFPAPSSGTEAPKARSGKRAKEGKLTTTNKKASRQPKKIKRETEDLNRIILPRSDDGIDDSNKRLAVSKSDWKVQDLGLNQVVFDETTMPPPVCSCTGVRRQCYKWGNGGWQSACCTTTLSMYPLPTLPNKRHARIGGRKMSGSAFIKLLSRLAAAGHDLSNPLDLKDHWARHGTNRYITIK